MSHDGFFAELIAAHADEHRATIAHPAVQAIADETLGDARFRAYLEQDYLFLQAYARAIASAAAVADSLEDVAWLARLLDSTVAVEMDAVARLYASFGGASEELARASMHPACRNYVDHLRAHAASGRLLVMLAALLPCQWGYREVAHTIAQRGLPRDERYRGWVNEYLSVEYGTLVDRMVVTLNREAEHESQRARQRAKEAFAAGMHHELAFWTMVANG